LQNGFIGAEILDLAGTDRRAVCEDKLIGLLLEFANCEFGVFAELKQRSIRQRQI
jgi:hypothetical protein